jgi:ABC-type sugar transport system, periplasmic component
MKRFLLVLLSMLLMCSSALAAVTPAGEFPVVDEPITLTIALPLNSKVQDIYTNELTKWIQEETGITLEFIELSTQDTGTQINLMFISGDKLPDMVWGYDFSYDVLSEYVNAGHIAPLDEYIEKYGVNFQRVLDATTVEGAINYITIDGKIYAMPTILENPNGMYANHRFSYQQEFLDALKMEEPSTLDELYNLLVAIRDNDVNGNGDPNDEIPMMGYAAANTVLDFIGSAYQYTNGNNFLKVNDGVVSFVADNDLFKETIEYIKKLVDEGLYAPESYTQDLAAIQAINIQGSIIGVHTCGSNVTQAYNNDTPQYFGVRPMNLLTGPYGYKATRYGPPSVKRTMVMTTACKEKEAAYRLMDFMFSEEAAMRVRFGIENQHWEAAKEGLIGSNGQQALFTLIGTQEWSLPSGNAIWYTEDITFNDRTGYLGHVFNEKYQAYPHTYYNSIKIADQYMPNVTGEELPVLLMGSDMAAEYDELKNAIVSYVKEQVALFVLGDRSMTEWEQYVTELQSMGVSEYVQLAQEAYDAL